MTKRSFFAAGFAALVALLLIFSACSQSNDPVTETGGLSGGSGTVIKLQHTVTSAEIKTALDNYKVVTLNGYYKDIVVIAEDKAGTKTDTAVHVPAGGKLIIGSNVILVFDDDYLSIAGTLEIANGGGLVLVNWPAKTPNPIASTGSLMKGGELIVKEGGLFIDMNTQGTLWGVSDGDGLGRIVYEAGSVAYGGGTGGVYYFNTTDPVTKYDLTTSFAKARKRFGPKDDPDSTIQLLSGELIQTKTKYELAGDAVLAKTYGISNGLTLEIKDRKTATLKEGVGFVLASGTEGVSGKLIGGGKLVAGNTEISGGTDGWQAVYDVIGGGTPAADEGVTIAAIGSAQAGILASANVQLTGGAGATIKQKQGQGNLLQIGATAATVINLGGTPKVAGAQFILEGEEEAGSSTAGNVIMTTAASAIQIGRAITGTAAGAASPISIGTKELEFFSIDFFTIPGSADATDLFTGLKSNGANATLKAGTDEVIIDSTQEVEG